MIYVPWMTYPAIDWLTYILKPQMSIFEWGSGGSTIFFCGRGCKVTSTENNLEWYNGVLEALDVLQLKADVTLIPEDPTIELEYMSSTGASYKAYVQHINDYDQFDMVVIDGRARPACIREALPHVKSGGWLVLDNAERKYYLDGIKLLEGHRRLNFGGKGPLLENEEWLTSVWKF